MPDKGKEKPTLGPWRKFSHPYTCRNGGPAVIVNRSIHSFFSDTFLTDITDLWTVHGFSLLATFSAQFVFVSVFVISFFL